MNPKLKFLYCMSSAFFIAACIAVLGGLHDGDTTLATIGGMVLVVDVVVTAVIHMMIA